MKSLIERMTVMMILGAAITCQHCFAVDGAKVVSQKDEMVIAARSADAVIQEAAMKQDVVAVKTGIENSGGRQFDVINVDSVTMPKGNVEASSVAGMAPNPGYRRPGNEIDPFLIARILAAGNPKPTPQPTASTPNIIQSTRNKNSNRTNLPGVGFKPDKPYYGAAVLHGVVNITHRVNADNDRTE